MMDFEFWWDLKYQRCLFIFSLTIDTALNITDEMTIQDINGKHQELPKYHVEVMIGFGWACFVCSWLINIAYYKFHPSSVDVFPSSLKLFSKEILSQKKFLYLFGFNVFEKNLFETRRKIEKVESGEELYPLQTENDSGEQIIVADEKIFSWNIFEKTKVEESEHLKSQNKILTEQKTKAEEESVKIIAEIEQLLSRYKQS